MENTAKQSISPLTKPTNADDRRRVVADVLGSWALESQEPTPGESERYAQYVSGAMTAEQLISAAKAS